MRPEKQIKWVEDKKEEKLRKLTHEVCQVRGHTQIGMPMTKFCDDDAHDALHCKNNMLLALLKALLYIFVYLCTH